MNFLGMDASWCSTIGALFGKTIAYAYDLMVKLAEGNLFENVGLEKVTASIYTLLGVFMVFRVLISMLNYLIDPDRINDKQVGAGKMLGRIVISIALLLTLNSYIFPLLGKAQSVILESNILSKIFSVDDETESYSSNTNAANTSKINFLWQDVKAEESINSFTCNYVYYPVPFIGEDSWETIDENQIQQIIDEFGLKGELDVTQKVPYNNPILLSIYFVRDGYGRVDAPYEIYDTDGEELGWHARLLSTSQGYTTIVPNINGNNGIVLNINAFANGKSNFNSGYCPTAISISHDKKSPVCSYDEENNYKPSCTIDSFDQIELIYSSDEKLKDENESYLYGNFRSFGTINHSYVTSQKIVHNNNNISQLISAYQRKMKQIEIDKVSLGLAFSKGVVRSFITIEDKSNCEEGTDCYKHVEEYLDGGKQNLALAKDVKSNTISFDYLIALVVGIALFIILMVLCIEVIVRNFKLWLLQVISPIPVVSYINPNDKIFNQWVKMYGSAYADLFIKLIALHLTQILITIVLNNKPEGLVALLYFGGIFTFAKTAPNLISKLFGIDGAGTFGNTMGMIKAGLAGTAGAALASGAGLIGAGRNMFAAGAGGLGAKGVLAAGARGLGSTFGAGLRGFGAGTKGNVMSGAKAAWGQASNRSGLLRQGVGTKAQIGASILGGVASYAANTDRKLENVKNENEALKRMQEHKDEIRDIAKKDDTYKDIVLRKDGNNDFYGTEVQKAMDKAYTSANYDIYSNSAAYKSYLKTNNIEDNDLARNSYIRDKMKFTGMDYSDCIQLKYSKKVGSMASDVVFKANADTSYAIEGVTSGENAITKVETIDDIYDLESKATAKFKSNDREIYRRTTADPRYNASKAANDARNGKG